MNVLQEYTLEYVKKNKKSSIASMIAIFIATVLLCSVCIYQQTQLQYSRDTYRYLDGDWHGELARETQGKYLDTVKAHANVEEVMVKGKWQVAKIGEDEKRPYIVMRDFDATYWESMPEKNVIIEGRIPQAEGEIVLSKQILINHPEIKIGEELVLDMGNRMIEDQVIDPVESLREEEVFQIEEQVSYTVVGILDIITSSVTPGYAAMGYLEHASIQPEDGLAIFMRMKDPRSVYEDLPEIAKQVGCQADKGNQCCVRYNTDLLVKHFIFPTDLSVKFTRGTIAQVITMAFIGLMIMGLFVFIIHNAFMLSMQSRMKQLGMFKSIGATPTQIRKSVTFEAFLLSVIPIPLGMAAAVGINKVFFNLINQMNQDWGSTVTGQYIPVEMRFGWQTLVLTLVMVGVTVWFSAYLPAKIVSKDVPIRLIKGQKEVKRATKDKKKRNNKKQRECTDIYKEISRNSLKANSRSFKIAIITLTLSFTLVGGYYMIMASAQAMSTIQYLEQVDDPIRIYIESTEPIEEEVLQEIKNHPQIDESIFLRTATCTILQDGEQASEEMKELGGFESVAKTQRYTLISQEDQYRINSKIIGLDDESFTAYCKEVGVDPAPFYDVENGVYKTILYHNTPDRLNDLPGDTTFPLLDLEVGDQFELTEKDLSGVNANPYQFTTSVEVITEKLPVDYLYGLNVYSIMQILPMDHYNVLVESFNEHSKRRIMQTNISIYTEEAHIREVVSDMTKICDVWYGQGDYRVWDEQTEKESQAQAQKIMGIMVCVISGLFAIIGVTNAFTSIYGSLRQRRREFAMLRSIGVDSEGVKKLLINEGIYFATLPFLMSLPIIMVVQSMILYLQQVSWYEIVPHIEWLPVSVCALMILGSILVAYWMGSQRIRKDEIIEAIKDETI